MFLSGFSCSLFSVLSVWKLLAVLMFLILYIYILPTLLICRYVNCSYHYMSVEMNLSQKTCTSPLFSFGINSLSKCHCIQLVEGIKRLRTLLLTRRQNHSLGHNVKPKLMFLFWSPVHLDIPILADWVFKKKKKPITYLCVHSSFGKGKSFFLLLFLPSTSLQSVHIKRMHLTATMSVSPSVSYLFRWHR